MRDNVDSVLHSVKLGVLRSAQTMGVFAAVRQSKWRTQRLLILCYHGISFADEHLWKPALYVSRDTFRQRLRILRDNHYNVLPLGEALLRLENGTLPPRSVVITFDDGEYNFYTEALPLLREFGFPATVYLTTYYCLDQRPVFDVAASYLIWKGCGKTLSTAGLLPDQQEVRITPENHYKLFRALHLHVTEQKLSADQKHALNADLARRLDLDYEALDRSRMFHIMTPEEVAKSHQCGVSIELHTHSHRTPRDRDLFLRQVRRNRQHIVEITGTDPQHFCYPSGDYTPEYFSWLRQEGVLSATSCNLGFAAASSETMCLPRVLDLNSFSGVEFESWLSGVSAALPRREHWF